MENSSELEIGKIKSSNVTKVGLVIMASGLGKRFGGNKLLEMLGDRPVIQWIIDTTDGLFDKRVVVTRSEDIKVLCDRIGIDCILHELPGRNDTVRLGLAWLERDIDYCFFSPADQPLITSDSIASLIAASRENSEKIIRAGYNDLIGAPTGFPKKYFDELKNLPDHKGGNFVVAMHSDEVIKVDVGSDHELMDIDTVSDLEKIKNTIGDRSFL